MNGRKINLKIGKEVINGKILGRKTDTVANFVFFHGAGKSTKKKAEEFFNENLLDLTSNIVTFDFSGHGESTGRLEESSLQKRIFEAKTIIESYTTQKNLTICGSSMGGYIALKMLEFFDIKNIVLFAPAIYDKRAINVQFNKGFTKIIRKSKSWGNSDIFQLLRKFKGNLLLFIGKNDKVIPEGVVDLINKHAIRVKKKEIIRFNNCSHAIHCWLNNHPAEKKSVNKKIIGYYLDKN